MNHELISTALTGFLALSLWWLFAFAFRSYWIDATRQRLFNIRDDLFDQVQKSDRIAFDDPAYGIARTTINGMIQFTHDISVPRIISIFVMRRFPDHNLRVETYQSDFKGAVEGLSNEGKKIILRALADSHIAFAKHLIHTSIILWPFAMPFILLLRMTHNVAKVRRWILHGSRRREHWSVLDAMANMIGHRA